MSNSIDAKYDSNSGALKFSLNIPNGNICYFIQSFFFAVAAIGMYMIYAEANVITLLSGQLDSFNLIFSAVALLLLNETFFIPDRWRLLCRIVACYLVWNNLEQAGCTAKSFFHDIDAGGKRVTDLNFTGNQVRIARCGMLFVLFAIVGSFLASYLAPNGRTKTSFSSYKFVQSSVLQSVMYCIAVVLLLVATFVQWSREDTCGGASAPAGTAAPGSTAAPTAAPAAASLDGFKHYNATLLFLAFWILFGLCTNDSNSLDIGFAIISSEIINGRPTPYSGDTKLVVIYSCIFVAALFMIIGSMLHSGIYLNGFTTTGFCERIKTWGFLVHLISIILGVAGSACIFSRTDNKDDLWLAFFTGWATPLLGLLGHLFDAEAAILPALFYVPQAFNYYGTGFVESVLSSNYPKGYVRAGQLLLMIVPLLSTMTFYARHMRVESMDNYMKSDGAQAMKASMILFLSSALYWKAGISAFWAVAFIAFMVLASSYNQRTGLPKASLLLSIQAVTIPQLWLLSNDPSLTILYNVVIVIGFWMFIGTFGAASPDMSTVLECVHELNSKGIEGAAGGDYAEVPSSDNNAGAPLLASGDNNTGYNAVGGDEQPVAPPQAPSNNSKTSKRPPPPAAPQSTNKKKGGKQQQQQDDDQFDDDEKEVLSPPHES